jgi:hypothetical protein
MKISLSQLVDINERLDDASLHLRAQRSLARNLDGVKIIKRS